MKMKPEPIGNKPEGMSEEVYLFCKWCDSVYGVEGRAAVGRVVNSVEGIEQMDVEDIKAIILQAAFEGLEKAGAI